jgi:hypothetical protein
VCAAVACLMHINCVNSYGMGLSAAGYAPQPWQPLMQNILLPDLLQVVTWQCSHRMLLSTLKSTQA